MSLLRMGMGLEVIEACGQGHRDCMAHEETDHLLFLPSC